MKGLLSRINKRTAILGMVFLLVLDLSYALFMSDVFGIKGYTLDIKWVSGLLMFPLVAFAGLLIPVDGEKRPISHKFHVIFFYMAYIPILSYYSVGPTIAITWVVGITMFYPITFLTSYLLNKWEPIKPDFKFSRKVPKRILVLAAFVLAIASIVVIIVYTGLPKSFSFVHVYETRERLSSIPSWGKYLMNWSLKIGLTFLIIYFVHHLRKSNYHVLGLVATIALVGIFYAITGHKILLVSLFILITFYILLKRQYGFEKSLFIIFTVLIVGSIVYYYLGGSIYVPSLVVRRSFFLPARISFGYYDFFLEQKLYLSHSIFKSFIETDIPSNHAHLIADKYLNITGPSASFASANNGIFSDGYKNFGWYGVTAWSVIVSAVLYLLDRIALKKDMYIFIPLFVLSLMTWINSAMFTNFITHGLLLLVLLGLFYPSSDKGQVKEDE